MAMEFTINNIFAFVSYILPFMTTLFFIMIGFLDNRPLASIIMTSLILLVTVITSLSQNAFKTFAPVDQSPFCSLFNIPFIGSEYSVPSIQIVTMAFIVAYTLIPMFMNHNVNIAGLVLMVSLLTITVVSKFFNKCTTILGIIISVVMGILFGTGFSVALQNVYPELLYFGPKRSNNKQCGMASNKTFRCAVYKNGKLLKTL